MKHFTLILCASLGLLRATAADYSKVIPQLETVIREEMREWTIEGVAVALVDDQQIVYAAGFGEAKRDSLFRVGSISKLLNAVAVMQQVEAGRLDLDAPLPADVSPINPFPGEPKVTLRQLLSHRSGLVREGSVGGYMDDSESGLAATVASVPASVLVTKPGEKARYSNLAPSLAGRLVERASGMSFEDYQQTNILNPLGMTNSAWTIARLNKQKMITSHMRIVNARGEFKRKEAPLFDLGTIPAGNLFSSVDDLAHFASALIAGGNGVLKTGTLEKMWKPQFTEEKSGFGLAFMIGNFREHRTVGHNGAVYGHSTSLVVLPEKKIAVIVLANEDIVNGRVRRISNFALAQMLEAKFGEAIPVPPATAIARNLGEFVGDYESESYWAELSLVGWKLVGNLSSQLTKFTPTGDLKFIANSHLEDATTVTFTRDNAGNISGFNIGAQHFKRVSKNPSPLPKEWRAVLGSYGPKFIPTVISERHGHLYAMTENMVDYRLTPINRNACLLPPGMYVDEQVVFLSNSQGHVNEINFANMNFLRR